MLFTSTVSPLNLKGDAYGCPTYLTFLLWLFNRDLDQPNISEGLVIKEKERIKNMYKICDAVVMVNKYCH